MVPVNRFWSYSLLTLLAIMLNLCLPVVAQQPSVSAVQATPASNEAEEAAKDKGWPRLFKAKGYEIFVHQPQIEEWKDYKRITFRSAIVVGPEGSPRRPTITSPTT